MTGETYIEYYISKDGNIKQEYQEEELIHIEEEFREKVYPTMDDNFKRAYDLMGFILRFASKTYSVFFFFFSYFIQPNKHYETIQSGVRILNGEERLETVNMQIQKDFLLDRNLDIIFADFDFNEDLYVKDGNYYRYYTQLKNLDNFITNYKNQFSKERIFDHQGNLKAEYHLKTLEDINLRDVDFDEKCLAYINISKNKEAQINFDKIKKDIHNANFRGYNLKGYTLSGFNIIDTDLRKTGATVDLATCSYSIPGKMSDGTLFDEENSFVRGGMSLTPQEVETFGVKVLKKEMM